MWWKENLRRLSKLSPWTALLMAAFGCGGGDKSPTGPGGDAAEFELVALGRAGLPADTQLEDCTATRFYGGAIRLDPATGRWQIALQVHDDNSGDWGYRDEGQAEADGDTVWFDSQISGTSYAGTVNGTEVKIMYDWCYNGVPDVQLVFAR
jgi:hypothetical protein